MYKLQSLKHTPIVEAADKIMVPLLDSYTLKEIETNSADAVCYTIFAKKVGSGSMDIIEKLSQLAKPLHSTNARKMELLIRDKATIIKFYNVIDGKYDLWLEILTGDADYKIESSIT